MRSEFKGWYKPTDAEFEVLWSRGIITLDANALLAPYRVSERAQRQLFDVAEAYEGQLWCPHQAGLEYQRNRLKVISDQVAEYDSIRTKLENAKATLLHRRKDHPVLDADRFEDLVNRSLAGIERFIAEVQRRHPRVLGEDRDDDKVRGRWDELLDGKVGPALAVDDAWRANADKRYEKKVPPGFEDQKRKKDGREYGDLILWCELIEQVRSRAANDAEPMPVILVTDDLKEDWWRIFLGQRLGPDPALTEEIAGVGGAPFWIYTVSRFIETGASRLGWEVEPEGPAELRSAGSEYVGEGAEVGANEAEANDPEAKTTQELGSEDPSE